MLFRSKSQIDRDFESRAKRREGNLPSPEELELALALASRTITGPLHHLLEVLRDGPEVSPQQIQRRSGAEEDALIRDLVRLARALADILSVPLPKGTGSAPAALDLIAETIALNGDADEPWRFRGAFVTAAEAHLAR